MKRKKKVDKTSLIKNLAKAVFVKDLLEDVLRTLSCTYVSHILKI